MKNAGCFKPKRSGDLKIMTTLRSAISVPVAVLMTLVLAGCGGSSDSGSGTPAATTYTIGGVVIGLNANSEVPVLYGGASSLEVKSDGSFTLPTPVPNGTSYTVAVGTSPVGQSCGVQNGAGVVSAANVTNIYVFCTDNVTAATLNGTYDLASLNINNDTDQLYSAVAFNGAGTQGSSTVTSDQAGTTFATTTDSGGPYTVTTSLALPVLNAGANSQGAIAGADGDEFYWLANALNANGAGPALVFGVKPLATATAASLTGNWTIVGLTQAATPYDSEESLTINTDGSFSGSQSTLDVTGAAAAAQAISGPAGSFSVTNNIVSTGGNAGYISANGEFLMLTFVTQQAGGASANYPDFALAVKQGSGVTLATLSGIYSIGTLGFNTASTGDGQTITLFFDGAGNFNGTYAQNVNGVSENSGTAGGTYAVTSSGVLTLTDSTGSVYTGAVSADGNLVVAAALKGGGTQEPEIFAGFRQ
jgi:hypothetical protein